MNNQKLNYRQVKWALYLSRFDFILKHISESKIEKANSLNKRPNQKVKIKKNNEEQMLVKKEQLEAKEIRAAKVIIKSINLLDKVKKCEVKDDEVVKTVKEMKQAGVKMLKDKK